ncbi:type 1 glutamine amidotransferase [Parafilimonas sp.]|uniref:type 1 glutamine amidotransferase n=1 Tax=Parafilimonas sp. TaxID=1969739 RepID=UPI0039E6948F
MHIHFIQHMPFEHPASIADWAAEKSHATAYTKVFEEAAFPLADSFDMLVIMGGVMGVYEEDKYSWMPAEKTFIKQAIEAKKKVLGVCLGAQFIAAALGAKVFPHTLKEIGWLPVEKVTPHPLTNHLPHTFTTFHWHGDTFTLPDTAIHLFKTKGCAQQGFVYNNHVVGLQFHAEVKEDLLNGMTEHERAELIKADFVQTEAELKTLMQQHISLQKQYMFGFLETFAQL